MKQWARNLDTDHTWAYALIVVVWTAIVWGVGFAVVPKGANPAYLGFMLVLGIPVTWALAWIDYYANQLEEPSNLYRANLVLWQVGFLGFLGAHIAMGVTHLSGNTIIIGWVILCFVGLPVGAFIKARILKSLWSSWVLKAIFECEDQIQLESYTNPKEREYKAQRYHQPKFINAAKKRLDELRSLGIDKDRFAVSKAKR